MLVEHAAQGEHARIVVAQVRERGGDQLLHLLHQQNLLHRQNLLHQQNLPHRQNLLHRNLQPNLNLPLLHHRYLKPSMHVSLSWNQTFTPDYAQNINISDNYHQSDQHNEANQMNNCLRPG